MSNKKTTQISWRFLLSLALLMAATLQIKAQNVILSPKSGSMIAAASYSGEVGHQNGWNSMWRHNQLPLTITVADEGTLTTAGELKVHAGNLNSDGDSFLLMGGTSKDCYMVVSLPRGYKFTGYSITMLNNLNGQTVKNMKIGNLTKTFVETDSSYDTTLNTAKTEDGRTEMSSSDETKPYVISSQSETMGNRLYFCIKKGNGSAYYGVTITAFEAHFTTDEFTVSATPSVSGAVSYTAIPFYSGKVDIGAVSKKSTGYQYDYTKVADAVANASLYQDDAVENGEAKDVAANKHISSATVDGSSWYALQNDTYFIESPTTVTLQDNSTIVPVGYRITGAKFKLHPCVSTKKVITVTSNGQTLYLNTSLNFTSTPVFWEWDGSTLKSGNTYLDTDDGVGSHKLSTTTSKSSARSWSSDNSGVLSYTYAWNTYYIVNSGNKLSTNSSGAAKIQDYTELISNYTFNLYGTDKENIVKTQAVSDTDAEIEISNLNNDAVMFTVSGLEGDASAYVQVELTMEALNPYVSSIDVVCKGDGHQELRQTLQTNNFEVRGGKFTFYVPKDWEGKGTFTFENLRSNKADDTYGPYSANGTSRYNFVQSDYWTGGKGESLYGANYDPTAAYTTKINTVLAGNVPFRFSNIDELNTSSTSTTAKQLEEYPFSVANYKAQTTPGQGDFVTFSVDVNGTGTAYLFVADEARYNIAPTTATEHRYFAYYQMEVSVLAGDYTANVEFSKIYDATCYAGDLTKAMYGAKVYTTDPDGNKVSGYLTTSGVKKAIDDAIAANTGDAPQATDQILYIDLYDLSSFSVEEITFEELRQAFAPNTLIYLPRGIKADAVNYASRIQDMGAFYACDNIVITDRYPFYAPFGIGVGAEQTVSYTRNITVPANGKVRNATVMLPFTISVDGNGLHTNADGSSFTVKVMDTSNCISTIEPTEESFNYTEDVHFVNYSSAAGVTEANKPYMINVETAPESADASFTIVQRGCNIEATLGGNSKYLYTGSTSKGTLGETSYTFTPTATYAGVQLAKTGNYFYFAKGIFVNSNGISGNTLYVYPFRAFYEYAVSNGAAAKSFGVAYGPNENQPTEIAKVKVDGGDAITVTPSYRSVNVSAKADTKVRICDMSGAVVESLTLKSGDSADVALPAGIYVVNRTKVSVK